MNAQMYHRPATFTEANAWVQLSPESFTRHFPYIRQIWQAADGRVWLETDGTSWLDERGLAWWEREARQTGEPMLPCGCRVRVHYVPHARKTICTFWSPAIAFHTKLRISGRLMLSAASLSGIKDALCVHPHDQETVEQRLAGSLAESR